MDSFIVREGDYAIRIMVYLAGNSGLQKVDSISESIDVPKPTVAKVINKLKKSGLIKTRTGKNGGIEVDKMVLDKSLYDILNAMGIRMEMNVCINHPEICSQKPFCKVTHRLGAIQTVMMSMLMDSKIKDFI